MTEPAGCSGPIRSGHDISDPRERRHVLDWLEYLRGGRARVPAAGRLTIVKDGPAGAEIIVAEEIPGRGVTVFDDVCASVFGDDWPY